MVDISWIDKQIGYLTVHLGSYGVRSGEHFFFEPDLGWYNFIAQGTTTVLNEAMRMLAGHIQSPSVPIVESRKGSDNLSDIKGYDWISKDLPPGFIHYDGPQRSRILITITQKHDRWILGAILAHELTHHFLQNHRISHPNEKENERLTDMATVYLGFGKLTLNGYEPISWTEQEYGRKIKHTYRVGYLSMREIASVFERICTLRHISLEDVQTNLSTKASRLLVEARHRANLYEKKKQAELAKQERRKARKEKVSSFFKKMTPWIDRTKKPKESQQKVSEEIHEDKMIITCGNCGQKMRTPIMEFDIRVKCPSCKRESILRGRKVMK